MPRTKQPKPEPRIERSELYGGRVVIDFRPDARKNRYVVTVDGEVTSKPPSVTTITATLGKDSALINWAINNTVDIVRRCIGPGTTYTAEELEKIFQTARKRSWKLKQEAADIGTLAHDWLCRHFRGEAPALPSKDAMFRPCIDAVLDWAASHNIRFLYNERTVYSLRHKFAGRLDGVVEIDGVIELLDFKTGGIYPEAWFQTAAYTAALEEELPEIHIQNRRVVRLHKLDGVFSERFVTRDRMDRDCAGFLGLKKAYEAKKQIEADDRKEEREAAGGLAWLMELEA